MDQTEAHRKLALVESMAGVGHWRFEFESGCLDWSDQIYEIYGVTRDSFLPTLESALGAYHPEDSAKLHDHVERSRQTGLGFEILFRLNRADGVERLVEAKADVEIKDEQPFALVGVFQDVTERVRAFEALRVSEAGYRLLADHSTDIITRLAPDSTILYCSPATELFAIRAPKAIGRRLTDYVHPDDADALRALLSEPFGHEQARQDIRIVRANGITIWLEGLSKILRDERGNLTEAIVVFRDISARKALEAELQEARRAAERASQAKSVFLANMSHEIRTPLNGVIGIAAALAKSNLTDEQRELVDLVQSSGHVLERLLSDILDLSKIEANRLQLDVAPFDLRESIELAGKVLRLSAEEKKIGFRVLYGAGASGQFSGDSLRIKQILFNLASNAIKFTEKGHVEVRVTVVDPISQNAPSWITIDVADTGPGFSAEFERKLFQRFTQEDANRIDKVAGAGLGLSICAALCDLMGGEIKARSILGVGSTFSVRLPLMRCAAAQKPRDAADVSPVSGAPLRVLVAEDHPTNQRVVDLILRSIGAEITIANNGREAVDAFRAQKFDLILMDMQMPEMDGLAATRTIRRLEAQRGMTRTPIAMLTASVMEDHRLTAMTAGADSHITKPITPSSLIAGIEETLSAFHQVQEWDAVPIRPDPILKKQNG